MQIVRRLVLAIVATLTFSIAALGNPVNTASVCRVSAGLAVAAAHAAASPILYVLQLPSGPPEPSRVTSDGGWRADHVWAIEEIVARIG